MTRDPERHGHFSQPGSEVRDPRFTSLSTWGRKLWEVELVPYGERERLDSFLLEGWEPFGAFMAEDAGGVIALRRRPGHVE